MGCQTKSMGLAFHNKDVMGFGVLNAKPRGLIYGIGSLRIQTEALLAFSWLSFLKALLIWSLTEVSR